MNNRGIKLDRADNQVLDGRYVTVFFFCSTVGLGIFLGSAIVIGVGPTYAPFSQVLGTVFTGLLVVGMLRVNALCASEGFAPWVKRTLGAYVGALYLASFYAYFTLVMSAHARLFAEVIHMTVLTRTPVIILLAGQYLASYYLAAQGVETVARFLYVVVAVEMLIYAPLSFSGLTGLTRSFLQPALPPSFRSLAEGVVAGSAAYAGYGVLLAILPAVIESQATISRAFQGLGLAGVFMLAAVTGTVGTFGPAVAPSFAFPFIEYTEAIRLGGMLSFVHRVSFVFISFWVFAVLKTIVITYLGLTRVLTGSAGLSQKTALQLTALLILGVSSMPLHLQSWMQLLATVSKIGVGYGAASLLILLSLGRRRRSGVHHG